MNFFFICFATGNFLAIHSLKIAEHISCAHFWLLLLGDPIYSLWPSTAFSSFSMSYLNATAIKCPFLIRAVEIDNPMNRSFLKNRVQVQIHFSFFTNSVPLDLLFWRLLYCFIPFQRVVCAFFHQAEAHFEA